jgi:hypothetical protein
LIPVIAVVDYQTFFIESQESRTGESDLLAILDPTRPPFDCGAITTCNGFAEPALDILLLAEDLGQVGTDSLRTFVGLTERISGVASAFGIEVDYRFCISCGPRASPHRGPSTSCFLGVHKPMLRVCCAAR